MRIAYVNLLVRSSPGVERKVLGQRAALDQLGIDAFDIYVLNTERESVDGRLHHVRIPRLGLRRDVALGAARFSLIRSAVDLHTYDVVLLRYPWADPGAPSFAGDFPVVSEHHTKEIEQLKATLRSRINLQHKAFNQLSIVFEKIYAGPFLRRCRGLVGVTDEIRDHEMMRAEHSLRSITVANGITVDAVRLSRFSPFDGSRLRLVFLGGRMSSWQGVDRLLQSLSEYRGAVPVECHLVGDLPVDRTTHPMPSTVSVQVHGVLRGQPLDDLLGKMNLAVGTLALYRKGLTEACPLKIREYTARGLPFVLAHRDPDLEAVADSDRFFLPISNDEQLLDVHRVIAFAEEMANAERQTVVSDRMRSYALEHMDWSSKMGTLVGFLQHVAAGRSS